MALGGTKPDFLASAAAITVSVSARFEKVVAKRAGGREPFLCLRAANGAARRAGFNAAEVKASELPLLLPMTPLVHMRVDRPLDLVFLTRSGRVKRVFSQVAPSWRQYGAFAWSCLELPAGQASQLALVVGERLQIEATA